MNINICLIPLNLIFVYVKFSLLYNWVDEYLKKLNEIAATNKIRIVSSFNFTLDA